MIIRECYKGWLGVTGQWVIGSNDASTKDRIFAGIHPTWNYRLAPHLANDQERPNE